MTEIIKPLPPVKVKINFWNKFKLFSLVISSNILLLLVIGAGVNIIWYYLRSGFTNGFFDPETLKYAVFIVVGGWFYFNLDDKKLCQILNIRRDLPFITLEQTGNKN